MKIFELERMIPSKIRRKLYRFRLQARFLFWGILAILGIYLLAKGLPIIWKKTAPYIKLPWQVASIVTSSKPQLQKTNNRTNILLLGVGGEQHAAADLTDSIIFISVDLESGQAVFLSIPRDVWLESLKAKINTAYHYGEEKRKGGGLVLAKASVEEIVGQVVHYGLVLDFEGFVKAVDLVGRIEVEVERSFDDYQYPIPGKENAYPESERYEHLHFEAGRQLMDGETALKFARSRYAEGEEGTDFARSRRQQKVLSAFKEKIFSKEVLLSPGKIRELAKVFSENVDTDIESSEYPEFIKLAKIVKKGEITTASLETDEKDEKGAVVHEGLLINPLPSKKYQNQWVLVPKTGSWKEVHEYVERLLGN